MIKYNLTFQFFDTQEQAQEFCDRENASGRHTRESTKRRTLRRGRVRTKPNTSLLYGIIIKGGKL